MKIAKTLLLILLAVAISVTATVFLSKSTNGFNDSFASLFLNKDNLVHTLEEYQSEAGERENGLTWTVKPDTGVIYVSGEISSDEEGAELESDEFVIGSVLVENTDFYTLSGIKKADKEKIYLKAEYRNAQGNDRVLYGDIEDEMTSPEKILEGTYVTISIVVLPGVELENVKITPTFVPGVEPGNF